MSDDTAITYIEHYQSDSDMLLEILRLINYYVIARPTRFRCEANLTTTTEQLLEEIQQTSNNNEIREDVSSILTRVEDWREGRIKQYLGSV